MNVVLLADKKYKKAFENAVKKNAYINLLNTEIAIRGNTMSHIAELNPHVLVIYRDVTEKDGIKLADLISFLRMKKPEMRIVFVYGKIADVNSFVSAADYLLTNDITDIVTDNSLDTILRVVDSPMEAAATTKLIEKLTAVEEPIDNSEPFEQLPTQEYKQLADVDFPTVTAKESFDIDTVVYATSELIESEHITIGISQLQHHNGCTHTAFELATTLLKKGINTAVIIADDDTFEGICTFNRLNPVVCKEGLNVHGIDVFPFDMRKEILCEYSVIILDFSYLREEKRKYFDECDIKLMLSSSAVYDVNKITNFIKYNDISYVHSITYLFPRVAQGKFLKYSKLLRKSGLTAYRLSESPDWSAPSKENTDVYEHIIETFKLKKGASMSKRKLFRIK